MMVAKFRNRGLAYQCAKCGKIDRHCRIEAHVLKNHVPVERVPFYCTLCTFRCQDRQKLVDHLTKYKRHQLEEAKSGPPNYSQILQKSANPLFVTERDMRPLSRAESYRWHARLAGTSETMDVLDGLFSDDEEVNPADTFPWWMADGTLYLPCPRKPTSKPASVCGEAAQSTRRPDVQPSATITTPYSTLSAMDLADLMPSQTVPVPKAAPAEFTTPLINYQSAPTPLHDELDLLVMPDANDPLLAEVEREPQQKSQQAEGAQSRQEGVERTEEGAITEAGGAGNYCKEDEGRKEESPIAAAIMSGVARIVESIDSNTRAIRNQDKTLEKVVGELVRIERRLSAMERRSGIIEQPFRRHDGQQGLGTRSDENLPPTKKPRTR